MTAEQFHNEQRRPTIFDKVFVRGGKTETRPTLLQDPIHINRSNLSSDASSGLPSPVSPEFDSLTELPSPIITDSPMTSVSPFSVDILSVPSSRLPSNSLSPKKNYGSLTSRPSLAVNDMNRIIDPANRITSEFNPIVSSPPKRTFSSPLSHEVLNNSTTAKLEREEHTALNTIRSNIISQGSKETIYEGFDQNHQQYLWKDVKQLGKGNFSTVVLGELISSSCKAPVPQAMKQVAIKIVLLPNNKETKNRIESSLRRELELLRIVDHPSIINLLALNISKQRYLIMTHYYSGGDLFELASNYKARMSPVLIRRIFAEIAIGVKYLHANNIVHRDIKLENILINLDVGEILRLSVDQKLNQSLITITDFGLSRKIDPQDPLLTTRCGSEDYVPPELLIGMPYDGRQTDSWALGVLLYSIMESRLPFDAPPNTNKKSIRSRNGRVAHRIAKIEWSWYEFDEESKDTKWNSNDWSEPKYLVENLLIRRENRLTSAQVCSNAFVDEILPDKFKVMAPLKKFKELDIEH